MPGAARIGRDVPNRNAGWWAPVSGYAEPGAGPGWGGGRRGGRQGGGGGAGGGVGPPAPRRGGGGRPAVSAAVGAGAHTRRTASGGVVGRLEPPAGSAVTPTPSAPSGPPVSSIAPEELPVSTSPAGSMAPLRLYQSSYTR